MHITGNHGLVIHANMTRSFVAIGAVLTILSLAIDPFVQQVISFEDRQVSTTTNFGTIPQARRYSKGTEVDISATRTAIILFQCQHANYLQRLQLMAPITQWLISTLTSQCNPQSSLACRVLCRPSHSK
jgi:hypothetical protein